MLRSQASSHWGLCWWLRHAMQMPLVCIYLGTKLISIGHAAKGIHSDLSGLHCYPADVWVHAAAKGHVWIYPYCSWGLCWCLWPVSPQKSMQMLLNCVAAWCCVDICGKCCGRGHYWCEWQAVSVVLLMDIARLNKACAWKSTNYSLPPREFLGLSITKQIQPLSYDIKTKKLCSLTELE